VSNMDGTSQLVCPECGSMDLIKYGVRFVRRGGNRTRIQQYMCTQCGRITIRPDSFLIEAPSPMGEPVESMAIW